MDDASPSSLRVALGMTGGLFGGEKPEGERNWGLKRGGEMGGGQRASSRRRVVWRGFWGVVVLCWARDALRCAVASLRTLSWQV